jgi:hypothetical protein
MRFRRRPTLKIGDRKSSDMRRTENLMKLFKQDCNIAAYPPLE